MKFKTSKTLQPKLLISQMKNQTREQAETQRFQPIVKYQSERQTREDSIRKVKSLPNSEMSRTFRNKSDYIGKSNQKSNPVGPGQYNVSGNLSTENGKSFARSNRESYIKPVHTPGVGKYEVKVPKGKSPKYSFLKSDETELEMKKKRIHNSEPSPFSYNTQKEQKLKIPISFPKSSRPDTIRFTIAPGPGAYVSVGDFSTLTSRAMSSNKTHKAREEEFRQKRILEFVMRNKEKISKKEKDSLIKGKLTIKDLDQGMCPAPNAYQYRDTSNGHLSIEFKKSKRTFSFKGGFSYVELSTKTPGPQYNVEPNKKSEKGVKFSKFKRNELFKVVEGPGVGAYNPIVSVFDRISEQKKERDNKIKRQSYKFDFSKLSILNQEQNVNQENDNNNLIDMF